MQQEIEEKIFFFALKEQKEVIASLEDVDAFLKAHGSSKKEIVNRLLKDASLMFIYEKLTI